MVPSCSYCWSEIPPDRLSIDLDLALCVACNRMHRAADVSRWSIADDARLMNEPPPRGVRLVEEPVGVRIVVRRTDVVATIVIALLSLLLNALVWTIVASVLGIGFANNPWQPVIPPSITPTQFQTLVLVFLSPFMFMAVSAVWSVFARICGAIHIRIWKADASVHHAIGPIGRVQRFDPRAVWSAAVEEIPQEHSGEPVHHIRLHSDELTLTFGRELNDAQRSWVAAALRTHLDFRPVDKPEATI